jgi:hypothetical protein
VLRLWKSAESSLKIGGNLVVDAADAIDATDAATFWGFTAASTKDNKSLEVLAARSLLEELLH